MQPRRQDEDYEARPSMSARLRDPRIQKGPSDNYLMARREVMERSSPLRRSLSPPGRVVGGGDRRNGIFEERDFHGLGERRETDHLRSHSNRFGRLDERPPNYDENFASRDELRRKYDFCDTVDPGKELDAGLKRGDYSGFRGNFDELDAGLKRGDYSGFRGNFDGDTVFGVTEHQLSSDRRMILEHGTMQRGEYRLQEELDPSIRDADDAGQFSLSLRNRNDGRFNDEQNQYPDPFLLEKLASIEREERYNKLEKLTDMERMQRYGNVEELTAKSRNFSYVKGSASVSKEFSDISQLKEFGATPLIKSRMNIVGSYQDDVPLPTEVHPGSSAQQGEHYLFNRLPKRHSLERSNFAANHEDLLVYERAEFSPSTFEGHRREFMYPRHESRDNDNHSHKSNELSKKLYYHEQGGYYRGDNISRNVVDPTKPHVYDYSQRLHSSSDSWDHPSSRDQSAPEYLCDDRSLAKTQQVRMYLDRRNAMVEFDDKVSVEPEVPLLGIPARDGLSRRRVARVSERDALLLSGRENLRTPLDNHYEIEMLEHDLRRKGISSNEFYTDDLSRRSLKRSKYHLDEELNFHRSKKTLSDRMNNLNGEEQHERGGKWISEQASDFSPSTNLKYNHRNTRTGRIVDYAEHGRDSTSYGWRSSDDQAEYLQEHSRKPLKRGKGTVKGLPRYGLSNSYKSSISNQRHPFHSNVWIRTEDNEQPEEYANETWKSKVVVSSSESGPLEDPEDSEEFKQLVQDYFLSFSKIVNEKIGTRRRYQEQGRAGSLFCIVCGKSSSKEFLETRGLATHCYMSRKIGLRAQHLGLHKAICVLLGWNSVVDRDVITFTPQVISSSEALAQKEDLILWPPIIIMHDISLPASHSGRPKVFTKEAVEDFLRGKGISAGKTKVSPGMSAKDDIMVVKFLDTFSGLDEAKKLHNYFVDKKQGRTDFEQMALGYNTRKERILGDKLEESLLYGYMGISEDLDKVDFDTKRRCSIKSKREIEDIAEAPLRQ